MRPLKLYFAGFVLDRVALACGLAHLAFVGLVGAVFGADPGKNLVHATIAHRTGGSVGPPVGAVSDGIAHPTTIPRPERKQRPGTVVVHDHRTGAPTTDDQ